jgi:hypothetical protein
VLYAGYKETFKTIYGKTSTRYRFGLCRDDGGGSNTRTAPRLLDGYDEDTMKALVRYCWQGWREDGKHLSYVEIERSVGALGL